MTPTMSLLEQISILAKDHAQLLAVLGALAAPGGVWFWVDKFRNRTKVVVRRFALEGGAFGGRGVVMELENLGNQLTSLEPTFICSFVSKTGRRKQVIYRFQSHDRRLPPHEVKALIASHADPEPNIVLFANHIAFSPRVTRGSLSPVLAKDIEFARINRISFLLAHTKAYLGLARTNAA